MEIDGDSKVNNKEETRLSGTYIRSLVKQLASSRTKDTMNPQDLVSNVGDDQSGESSTKLEDNFGKTSKNQQTQQPQQNKKQVRRRLHTSRPYQERLLNMAEARREIVTALKQHRAAMKQASEQQKQLQQQEKQSQPEPMQIPLQSYLEQEAKTKSRRNARIYPSSSPDFPNYLDPFSCSCFPHHQPPPPSDPFSWSPSKIPTPPVSQALNFVLPNQPLGLNLNFQDFNNIESPLYHNANRPSIYSSPSSSSSPGISIASEEIFSMAVSREVGLTPLSDGTESRNGGSLHQVMDDEEIAEIRSIEEQHQIEWNDTMNLVTSDWWFKFLNSMELGPEIKTEDDGYHPFDEVMEFPSWLNTNENFLQPYFNDYSSDIYIQDPALPCMEIGEIEGMDGEWLA